MVQRGERETVASQHLSRHTSAAIDYVRVLEIPTPRWTAYDAKYYGIDMADAVPMTLQQRAYTSPIWYTP